MKKKEIITFLNLSEFEYKVLIIIILAVIGYFIGYAIGEGYAHYKNSLM